MPSQEQGVPLHISENILRHQKIESSWSTLLLEGKSKLEQFGLSKQS